MPPRAPRRKIVAMRVADLLLDPNNANVHDDESVNSIRASLRRFEQVKPIVVDTNRVVIAGNGTVMAAREESIEWLDGIVYDGDMDHARGYAIADNQTGRRSHFDEAKLAEQLLSLPEEFRDDLGFEAEAIERILADARGDGSGDGSGSGDPDDTEPAITGDDPLFDVESIISTAVEHYQKRGFPYPDIPLHRAMQQLNTLRALDTDRLRSHSAAYHVADPYHPERFAVQVSGRVTPVNNFAIEKTLRHVMAMIIENGGQITDTSVLSTLSWARNTQLAAQFRPAFALWYMRRFAPVGGRMLDTSIGWGGRLLGYAASDLAAYVGIDPSSVATAANRRMADDLRIDGVKLIQKPAEDVKVAELGGTQSIDFAITSPPYFAKEEYADEPTQSFKRYATADEWREGFLRPMLALQFAALKPGATNIVNIAPIKIGSGKSEQTVPLDEWTRDDAQDLGFEYVTSEEFPMPRVPGRGEAPTASEPAIIFVKPE